MSNRQVMLNFHENIVKEHIIYKMGNVFNVVNKIRRADVTENSGWVVLELDGEEEDIDQGLNWISGKGIRVDPVAGDVVEG